MILVDTSVWVDFFRGTPSESRRALHDLISREAEICLTDIIVTEILQGIREDSRFEQVKDCLLKFPVLSAGDTGTFIQAAQIFRACRKSGKTITKTVDCIIASIAIEHDLELLHKDVDFAVIAQCTDLRSFSFDRRFS